MRVLGVTTMFPSPTQPGAGHFNFYQLRELAKACELELVRPEPWTAVFSRGCTIPGAEFRIHRPTYFYLPGWAYGWHGHWYWASIRNTVKRCAKARSFDLVYGMFAYPDGWAASRAARRLGIPFVLKVHGSDVHRLRSDRSRRKRLREVLGSAKIIVAVSESLAREVRELAPGAEVRVVRNGVDLDRFAPGSKGEARRAMGLAEGPPLILYVGRMERVKGADFLPEISRRVGTPAQWALIGRGSLRPRLMRDMGEGNGKFMGDMPHERMPLCFQAADVVVIPSRAEGIPNSLLEALASDRPVVASAVGGIPEILGDPTVGRLVAAGEPKLFAEAIDETLKNPPPPGRARAVVAELSWERSGRELKRALEEAVR